LLDACLLGFATIASCINLKLEVFHTFEKRKGDCNMSKSAAGALRKSIRPSSDKYQVSAYLEANEAEAVKAIALAKDISISSVVVSLVKEGLSNEKYQTIIQAYRQFKNTVD
jgi:hypothetical protein